MNNVKYFNTKFKIYLSMEHASIAQSSYYFDNISYMYFILIFSFLIIEIVRNFIRFRNDIVSFLFFKVQYCSRRIQLLELGYCLNYFIVCLKLHNEVNGPTKVLQPQHCTSQLMFESSVI